MPGKKFQRHIADYFISAHRYAVLELDEITDTEYYFAEDHLIAFFKATQKRYVASLIMLWVLDGGGRRDSKVMRQLGCRLIGLQSIF